MSYPKWISTCSGCEQQDKSQQRAKAFDAAVAGTVPISCLDSLGCSVTFVHNKGRTLTFWIPKGKDMLQDSITQPQVQL